MSRKQILQGLMHAAQQGQKMREGTEHARKTLNETGLAATRPNQMGGNFIFDPQNPNANLRGQMNPSEVKNEAYENRLNVIVETILGVMEANYDRGSKEDRAADALWISKQLARGRDSAAYVKQLAREKREKRRAEQAKKK